MLFYLSRSLPRLRIRAILKHGARPCIRRAGISVHRPPAAGVARCIGAHRVLQGARGRPAAQRPPRQDRLLVECEPRGQARPDEHE